MKSVDTGEDGTMGNNNWFGHLFRRKNDGTENSTTFALNATADKGNPPLLGRDEILQPVNLATRDHQGKHHREAAEDSAGDEVRREDRGVPARDDRGGEVE